MRGLLFFPDTCEPAGKTYEAVVNEVASEGVWIATDLIDDNAVTAELPQVDLEMLQKLAGMLGDKPATSYDIGKLVEGVQQQLLESLSSEAPQAAAHDETEDDDEKK